MGTAATPTVAPICNSLASCGPYGGYGTSQLTGLAGQQPDRGGAYAVGLDLRRLHQRPELFRPAIAAVELPDRAPDQRHQHGFRRLCGQPHAAPGMVLQGQLSARRSVLPEQPGAGIHVSRHASDASADQPESNIMPFAAQGWNYSQSTGFSTFNALEAQYQKRFSHGLQTLVAFTWEKCLGDSNGDFNAENGSEGAPYEYFFNAHSVEWTLRLQHPEGVQLEHGLPIAVRQGQSNG